MRKSEKIGATSLHMKASAARFARALEMDFIPLLVPKEKNPAPGGKKADGFVPSA